MIGPVVVVGDALLDRDILGQVERVCPDAPVPVLDEREVIDRPGGAALAAVLAARTGTPTVLVTGIGSDDAGNVLRSLLEDEGVEIVDVGLIGATAEKIRMRADGQSLLRLDRGGRSRPAGRSPENVAAAIADARSILVADYGRGIAADDHIRSVLGNASVPLVWDPHPRGAAPVGRTTLATPNLAELDVFVPGDPSTDAGLGATVSKARSLVATWGVGALAVTKGAGGVLLVRDVGSPQAIPVEPVVNGDPCGAGDCFAASAAVVLGSGALVPEAVEKAARAARDQVAAGGPARAASSSSASTRTAPVDVSTLVATGGCFDLLHPGHVSVLQAARALGDRLVVLLNSDRSVARLKGPDRPLQPEEDRRRVLLALSCVDEVIIFEEDTPAAALDRLRPDIFVKGGDYAGATLPEAKVLERWGGQSVIVAYLDGRSTTQLLEGARRGS